MLRKTTLDNRECLLFRRLSLSIAISVAVGDISQSWLVTLKVHSKEVGVYFIDPTHIKCDALDAILD